MTVLLTCKDMTDMQLLVKTYSIKAETSHLDTIIVPSLTNS